MHHAYLSPSRHRNHFFNTGPYHGHVCATNRSASSTAKMERYAKLDMMAIDVLIRYQQEDA
jgi:catechol-2,3-dioxygenase